MLGFVFIHLLSKSLSFKRIPLRTFLSFSGGVGIAYVFLHLLPTLPESQEILTEALKWTPDFLPISNASYMVSLLGICIFYTMDRVIIKAWETREIKNPDVIESEIFWVHIGFFSLYNGMIGYLLALEPYDDPIYAPLFFIAFGLHIVTNDWSLRHHHENVYDKIGRWILVFSIITGWLIGAFFEISEVTIAIVESFVTGAMVLNVIKVELPPEREGSLHGFLSGILSASILFWFL
jgi:hypothetical protein